MSKPGGYISTLMNRRTQTFAPRSFAALTAGRQPLRPPIALKPVDARPPRNPIDSVSTPPAIVKQVVTQRIMQPQASNIAETKPAEDRKIIPTPPQKATDFVVERRMATPPVPAEPVVHHTESAYEVEVVREVPGPSQVIVNPERQQTATRERRIETIIDWPAQLTPPQRSTVRIEVERQARDRVAADPRAKVSTAQKLEVRVDQVNVRFDAPTASQPTVPRAGNESRFGGFFLARSLR